MIETVRSSALGRRGILVAAHSLFSLVVTWPLVWWLRDELPNGSEVPGTVAFFNLWTLRWNQLQLGDLYRNYWDAPIFHPEPGAFALSEAQPLTGLVFTPISWVSGNPILAYNVIVLLALTLNGLAAARLCRRLGVAPGPATLVGLLAQVLPFVSNELGVLQLAMVFPLLFLAEAVLAWAEEESWPRGLAIGAWLSVTFLTCGYYGLFALVVLGPAALVLTRRDWLGRRRLGHLAGAVALFAVVCGPILIAQASYTSPYRRGDNVVLGNSAMPRAYLTLWGELPGADLVPWLSRESGERLYPGTVVLGLAMVGAVLLAERLESGWRRTAPGAFLGVAIVAAFLLSLGLRLSVFGWQPYRLLRDHVPGFADLRSPFRAGVLVQAFLLPVAAVALDRLWHVLRSGPRPAVAPAGDAVEAGAEGGAAGEEAEEARQPVTVAAAASTTAGGDAAGAGRAGAPDGPDGPPVPAPAPIDAVDEGGGPGPDSGPPGEPAAGAGRVRPWLGRALAVAVVALAIAEVWPVPQKLIEVPADGYGTDWVDWLAGQHDPGTGDGSVAMIPFPPNGNYASYESTTVWMLAALDHGHPLVNGYSGLFPPPYDTLENAMREGFPSDSTIELLAHHEVSWVVAPQGWTGSTGEPAFAAWTEVFRPAFEGRDMVVYAFTPPVR